jgi:hypothetical protein
MPEEEKTESQQAAEEFVTRVGNTFFDIMRSIQGIQVMIAQQGGFNLDIGRRMELLEKRVGELEKPKEEIPPSGHLPSSHQ